MPADALDRRGVTDAVAQTEPDVVIHQLTAIPARASVGTFDGTFAATNRLRTEGTDILLAAARVGGARRFVAQSFCGWTYARTGGPVKTEEDPLDPAPVRYFRQSLGAVRYLEHAVTCAPAVDSLVLRYGFFYGPGTAIAPDGQIGQLVARRRLLIVGQGTGVWSLVHMADVAAATIAAVESKPPRSYNIADDYPARLAQWLPVFAEALAAKPCPRVTGPPAQQGNRSDDQRNPRRVQRQGQTPAGLDAHLPELARRLPRQPRTIKTTHVAANQQTSSTRTAWTASVKTGVWILDSGT